jgi:hypothetical protein
VSNTSVSSPPPIELKAEDWQIRYSPGMPKHPSADATGGWDFSFPLNPDGTSHVDYVTVPYTGRLEQADTLQLVFEIDASSDAVFDFHTAPPRPPNPGTTPANFHLFLEHSGDSSLTNPNYRWWSNPDSYTLQDTNGLVTLDVPLNPSDWSNVDGQFGNTDVAGFDATLSHMGHIGLTFGGGDFFGHGVYLDQGSATFHLVSYSIPL